ncbi:MAG: hypothetical protein PVF37_11465 [Desulfobacterales bacterium]
MTTKLTGKTIIVTGAGRGIVKALSLAYGREDAFVCCAEKNERKL